MTTIYGWLDLFGIVFSLVCIGFIAEPYTMGDIVWVMVILTGFVMWGAPALLSAGGPNLPVRYPSYVAKDSLVLGAFAWGATLITATFLVIWDWNTLELPSALLPAGALISSGRAFSIYMTHAWQAIIRA